MPKDLTVRATPAEIEMFFVFVAASENGEIREMLVENHTLVFATDEQGDTALYNAITIGNTEALQTARILVEFGADIEQSRVGEALQFDMSPHIRNEMSKIVLGVDLNSHSNAVAESSTTIAESQAYNKQAHIKKSDATLKKAAKDGGKGDGKCTIMSLHGEELNNIFKNLGPINMDQQKKLDQQYYQTLNNDPIMDLFDFSPSSFETNPKDTITPEDLNPNDFSSLLLGVLILLSYSYTSIEIA